MQEEIKVLIDTDLGSTPKSMKNLKSEIKDLRDALLNLNPATEDYNKVLKAAADRAKLLSDTQYYLRTSATDLGSKITTVSKLFSGLAGGFGAVRGALTLFGADSEDLNRTMVKLQSTIALVQGLQGFEGLSKTIKSAGIQFSGAINAVRGFVTSLGTIKGALIGTGLGAFAVVLGTLINQFMKLSAEASNSAEKIKESLEKQEKEAQRVRDVNKEMFEAEAAQEHNRRLREIYDTYTDLATIQKKVKELDEEFKLAGLQKGANDAQSEVNRLNSELETQEKVLAELEKEYQKWVNIAKENPIAAWQPDKIKKQIEDLKKIIGEPIKEGEEIYPAESIKGRLQDAQIALIKEQEKYKKEELDVETKGNEDILKAAADAAKAAKEQRKKDLQDRISDINDANNTITNLLKDWRETTSTEFEKLNYDIHKAYYDLNESFDTILKATNSKLEDRLGDASAKIADFYNTLDEKGKNIAFPWLNEVFGVFDEGQLLMYLEESSDKTLEEWFEGIRNKIIQLYGKKSKELSISNWLDTLLRASDLNKVRNEIDIQKEILMIYDEAEKAIKEGTLKAVDFSDYLTEASADIIITTNEQRVEQLKIILEQLNNLLKDAQINEDLNREIKQHIADIDTEITNLLINNSERRIAQEQKEAKNTQQQEAIKARARMQALSALGNVFSQAETLAEDNAEFAKTMAVFGALINTYQAAAEAFGQGMKINFWTAFGFAATALGYGLSLVASLKRIDKSNSSSTSSAAAPTINPSAAAVAPAPISYVNNVQETSGIDDDDRRRDTRVYILESEIAAATNLVKVRENNSRF